MSTLRRHLEGIEENLQDARRRAVGIFGMLEENDRNEMTLRLLLDLLIVEEHLESAMLAARDEPSSVTETRSAGDELPSDVHATARAEAEATGIRDMARALQSKARPQ